jgi:hypothetical protein
VAIFRELKAHLLLFDKATHRHDRGWPHPPREPSAKSNPKRRWKTVGIFHFPHQDEYEEEGGARNAGSC